MDGNNVRKYRRRQNVYYREHATPLFLWNIVQ